jgi:uncharacterized protein YdhG (YjbR/CyaY superfamily)
MNSVDKYINGFDTLTKTRLMKLREISHNSIPELFEKISYGVPTVCDKNGKYIAYFAGYKDFVSIYPVHLTKMAGEIEKYKSGKSTVRFKNSEPLPEKLISEIFAKLYEAYLTKAE